MVFQRLDATLAPTTCAEVSWPWVRGALREVSILKGR
jgi:hypothetical protein